MGVHKQRVLSFQAMYMYECSALKDTEKKKQYVLNSFLSETYTSSVQTFAVDIFCSAVAHISIIDSIIQRTIKQYFTDSISFKVLSITVVSILRVAIAELLFFSQLHADKNIVSAIEKKSLVIDEAIILSKIYAEDNAYKLVHALLDKTVIHELSRT